MTAFTSHASLIMPPRDPFGPRTRLLITFLAGFVLLTLGSCGKDDSASEVESLMRRQKKRDATPATDSASTSIDAAKAFIAEGDYPAAEAALKPLLISDPNHAVAKLLAARCAAAGGRFTAAISLLDEVERLDCDDKTRSAALALSATCSIELSDFELAETKLTRLLLDSGESNRARHQLAMILNHQGRRIEAAEHLRLLADSGDVSEKELFAMITYNDSFIDESLPKPNFGGTLPRAALGEAKRLRADGDLNAAKRTIEKLAAAHPTDTSIWAFMGQVYSELQNEADLQRWLSTVPENIEAQPEYWASLGRWLQLQERHREAVRCFLEAVSRDQTDRFSYRALAKSLAALNETAASERVNERADRLDETALIAKRIGRAAATPAELNRLAALLDQLDRTAEAAGWRRVAGTSLTPPSTQQSVAPESSPVDVTCGLVTSDWPLPDRDAMRTPTSPTPPVVANAPATSELTLEDVAASRGLVFKYDNGDDPKDDSVLIHQLTGGGIGVIDFDLDGWPDLYLSQGGGPAFDPQGSKPNRLFRNRDGAEFVDATIPSMSGDRGYAQGVTVADVNQDGFPDILVANIGPNVLLINHGDGTFERKLLLPSDAAGSWTTSIACGDLSGDHLPEIVEVNYIDDATALSIACTPRRDACSPSEFRAAADRVLTVAADGGIAPWDGLERINEIASYGFAAVIANFDEQRGNDLFIANDTGFNHFWVSHVGSDGSAPNVVDGKQYLLREAAQLFGCATGLLGQRQGCMGIAAGDFDRNSRLDLHVTNYWNQPADLYLMKPTNIFDNETAKRGLVESSRMTVAWGTQAADLDHDGWLDLLVLNGHVADHRKRGEPLQMQPQRFAGSESGFRLLEPTTTSQSYWSQATLGRTLAMLDFNRDGKLDAVASHLDAPLALLENQTQVGSGLMIDLIGTRSERDAIGAKVTLRAGEQKWTAWNTGGDGFLCTNESVIHFGLGKLQSIDELRVDWPSGDTQTFEAIDLNHRLLLIEGETEVIRQGD